MLNPVTTSITTNTFTDPVERPRNRDLGWECRLSMALGPVVGGGPVSAGWRSIFWGNIPIGLAALALTARKARWMPTLAGTWRTKAGPATGSSPGSSRH